MSDIAALIDRMLAAQPFRAGSAWWEELRQEAWAAALGTDDPEDSIRRAWKLLGRQKRGARVRTDKLPDMGAFPDSQTRRYITVTAGRGNQHDYYRSLDEAPVEVHIPTDEVDPLVLQLVQLVLDGVDREDARRVTGHNFKQAKQVLSAAGIDRHGRPVEVGGIYRHGHRGALTCRGIHGLDVGPPGDRVIPFARVAKAMETPETSARKAVRLWQQAGIVAVPRNSVNGRPAIDRTVMLGLLTVAHADRQRRRFDLLPRDWDGLRGIVGDDGSEVVVWHGDGGRWDRNAAAAAINYEVPLQPLRERADEVAAA